MADVLLTISGDARSLIAATAQSEAALGRLEATATKSAGVLGSVFSGIAGGVGLAAGLAGINGIAGAMNAVGSAAIGMNSKLEQAQIGFTSMLGSSEKAASFLKDLQQFANTTPFEFPGLLTAAQRMLAFGFQAKEVKPLLTAVGSAAAAMGAGQSGIDRITAALGQMKAATVVQAGELNQLTEVGVPAFDLLAKKLGITTGEVKKLVTNGKIASSVFIEAFQEWSNANFGDMMEKQSHTFEGAMSTIHDTLISVGARGFQPLFSLVSQLADSFAQFTQTNTFTGWADAIAGTISDVVRQLGDAFRTIQQVFNGEWAPDATKIEAFANAVGVAAVAIRDFVTWIQQLPEPVKAAGVAFTAVMLGAGPLGVVLNTVGLALKLLAAPIAAVLSPLGLLAVAVGTLAAAWTANIGGIQQKAEALFAVIGPAFKELGDIINTAVSGDIAGALIDFQTLLRDLGEMLTPLLAEWGQEFVDWITVAGPPMLAAATELGAQLLAWIGEQVDPILAQLTIWGEQFVAWITVAGPPMLAAALDLGAQLVAWIVAQVPVLLAQLTLWGQQFTAWIAPAIPPMIAAAMTLGAALVAWIAAQIPGITAQLLLWGAEFVAWVTPQIPVLLTNLGTLYMALTKWMIDQVPGITARLVEWGILFGAWVATTAIPELIKALPGIITTIVTWTAGALKQINTAVIELGKALAQGIYDGFAAAWAKIGPLIIQQIQGALRLPAWLTGGGAPPGSSGASTAARTHASPYLETINRVAAREGESATLLAALADTEQSDPKSVSPAGARGLFQVVPGQGFDLPGEDASDVETSTMQAIRTIRAKRAALQAAGKKATDDEIAAAYFGYGTDAGGMTTGGYQQRFREKQAQYTAQPARAAGMPMPGGAVAQVNQFQLGLDPGTAAAACGPAALAWFMNLAGRTPTAAEAVQLARSAGWDAQRGMYGPAAFGAALTSAGIPNVVDTTPTRDEVGALAASGSPFAISTGGTTDEFGRSRPGHYYQVQGGNTNALNVGGSGTALTGGAPTMSLDQILAMSGPMNAIITLAGQMGESLVVAGEQGGEAFTGLLTSATTLADGSTLVITQMGTDVTAAIVNSAGQVTAQYGTMATGVVEQSTAMSTGVVEQTNLMTSGSLTSVTALGDGTLTTVQTMSGDTIATVTDMAGQVTNQSATLANGVVLNMGTMETGTLTSVTQMHDGTITTVQDMAGNAITTVTNMSGQVTSQYTTMATTGGAAVTTLGTTSTTQFGNVATAATKPVEPIKTLQSTMDGMKAPNVGPIVSAFGAVESAAKKTQKAAEDAADAIKDINQADKGGSKSGSGKDSGLGKKAGGGWAQGLTLVGEEGPELVSFSQPAYISTASQTRGLLGGGNTMTISVGSIVIQGSDKDAAQLAEEIRTELIATASRLGGADRLFE